MAASACFDGRFVLSRFSLVYPAPTAPELTNNISYFFESFATNSTRLAILSFDIYFPFVIICVPIFITILFT